MIYAQLVDGVVTRYPVTQNDLRKQNPNVSFPAKGLSADLMASFGYVVVRYAPQPAFDTATHCAVEGTPVQEGDIWNQTWQVVPLTPEEIAAKLQALQDNIAWNTQQRLDDFARTRGYDGILSACTYASSTRAKFAAEGQYAVTARDATWDMLYTIMREVQAGTRPLPSGFADIEPELPVLAWPELPVLAWPELP
jgi:hypothetical protein